MNRGGVRAPAGAYFGSAPVYISSQIYLMPNNNNMGMFDLKENEELFDLFDLQCLQ
jgi:hypothetical protein